MYCTAFILSDIQAEFVDVRLLGEFEEPEWVVLPEA